MASFLVFLLSYTLLTRANAHPSGNGNNPYDHPTRKFIVSGNRNCTYFTQSLYASANNTNYTIPPPKNNAEYTENTIRTWTSGSTYLQDHIAGTVPTNGTYDIYMEYCEPKGGATKGVMQMTHCVLTDHSYWDITVKDDKSLSLVEAAINQGYATLTYDRLAVGKSSSNWPDGINVVQGALQTDIAIRIGQQLKDGSLGLGKHEKLIAVGHGFGSIINIAVASLSPSLLDANVLTGFTGNASINRILAISFHGDLANTVSPKRFKEAPNTYLLSSTQSIDQFGFFHYPNYTQAVLDQFTATKKTYTIGDLLSLQNPWFQPPANYTNPLFVVTGELDGNFCEGNCYSNPPSYKGLNLTSQLDTAQLFFPATKSFTAYVVPDTGHGVNFHTTAPMAYSKIFEFLANNGL